MASIVALLSSRSDRDAVSQATPRTADLSFCSGVRHLAEILYRRGSDITCIISDLRDTGGAPASPVLRSTLACGAPPVIVRTRLAASRSREVIRLASHGINVRLALNGSEDLIAVVSAAMAGDAAPDAQSAILQSLGAQVPDSVQSLFIAATVVGATRCRVAALAAAAGMSVRTAERQLKIAGVPSARRLLAWSLLAHVVWRIDVLECTPKQAALRAGFASRDALANFAHRHQGHTLNELCRRGFDAFLQRYVHELRGASTPAP